MLWFGWFILFCTIPNSLGDVFLTGAAMATLPLEDCYGTCSKFRANATGPIQGAFEILRESGVNAARLRLWVNPSPAQSYANLSSVLGMAKRAHEAGLNIFLSPQYSDTWTSGERQSKPAAWRNLTFSALLKQTEEYSREVTEALVNQGTPPMYYGVGNEVNDGMLFDTDQPCSQGGSITCNKTVNNWSNFQKLVTAAVRGVHSAYPPAKIAIHTSAHTSAHIHELVTTFYPTLSQESSFDLVALSFYPIWGTHNVSDICGISSMRHTLPGKKFIVMETGYPYKPCKQLKPDTTPFPTTPDGQRRWIEALGDTVQHGAYGLGAGVVWWGSEYVNCDAFECAGFWLPDYTGLPVLDGWKGTPKGGVRCS